MTDQHATSSSTPALTRSTRSGRWSRLCLKELRETLRDRRTLITLVLMPLLVYPILSMVFQRSLMSSWSGNRQKIVIAVHSKESADQLRRDLMLGDLYLREQHSDDLPVPGKAEEKDAEPSRTPRVPDLPGLTSALPAMAFDVDEISFLQFEDLEQKVRAEKADLGVLFPSESESGRLELIHREGSPLSQRALQFTEERIDAMNQLILRKRLRDLGRSPQLALRHTRRPIQVAAQDTTLSTIVPMILILMTVTGAVYPAIDLTAGERERGTLEMLMASPVPRLKLLLAKYVAVVSVAFLTALVNLTAMTITLQATGLSRVLFGDSGLSLARVAQILALLLLFATFFSAVLLALTSFARSFKEAQAYLIPLMLLSLGPGVVSLLPGLELRGILAITPVANMVLLARDLCGGGVNVLMASVAILSTGLYTLAAIGVAAKIFGTDAVMTGGQGQLRSLFVSEGDRPRVSSVSGALLCLAILFPIYFVVSNGLSQLTGLPAPFDSLAFRLVLSGAATSLLFGVIPLVAALLQRSDIPGAFEMRPAVPAAFTVALMLGLTLWPLAHELVLLTQSLGLSTLRPEQLDAAQAFLNELKTVSPILILLSMAVAPAVFEELFFRGYLFSALRAATTQRTTIVVSAILFGLFHVVSNSALSIERLLPSTFMGLVLGWLCYKSGSVLPGMLLHACHNGFLMMMAYYKEELAAIGFGIQEQSHMPATWIGLSVFSLVVGMWLIFVLPSARRT